jgi:hypothetical protein
MLIVLRERCKDYAEMNIHIANPIAISKFAAPHRTKVWIPCGDHAFDQKS